MVNAPPLDCPPVSPLLVFTRSRPFSCTFLGLYSGSGRLAWLAERQTAQRHRRRRARKAVAHPEARVAVLAVCPPHHVQRDSAHAAHFVGELRRPRLVLHLGRDGLTA